MRKKRIILPLQEEEIKQLKMGEQIYLSGTMYGARDAAHKKILETLAKGEKPPVNLAGETIYYVGPCPARPGQVIGSAGPTTSGRMDAYTPALLQLGLKGMIGKGERSEDILLEMQKRGAVYLAAVGGAGALLSQCIKKAEVVAYPELGPEAIWSLTVEDFPVVVIIDIQGNNLYREGPKQYARR